MSVTFRKEFLERYFILLKTLVNTFRFLVENKTKLDCSRRYTIANTCFFTFDFDLGTIVITKMLPSTSCDICTCKVLSCYVQWSRGYIYKKIHYFTLTFKVTHNVAKYPLHHVTYAPAKFEFDRSNGLEDAFTRKYIIDLLTLTSKVTGNVAKDSLHNVTYAPAKFEVATSNA